MSTLLATDSGYGSTSSYRDNSLLPGAETAAGIFISKLIVGTLILRRGR